MTQIHLAYLERFLSLVGGIGGLLGLFFLVRERFFRGITWRKALQDAEIVLRQIESQSWRPDAVVGLGRSGALWGGWLAGNLGSLPICVLDRDFSTQGKARKVIFNDGEQLVALHRKRYGDGARLLVVEGANTSGQPFAEFNELVRTHWPGCQVKYAALYSNKASSANVDFVGRRDVDPYPDKFPWHVRASYRTNLGMTRE